ncbi:eukaryotic peptide chain release factor subunit 1 [Moniliophthora roreri]|nr:eukaryotic peptide chain release factor subunit 1 [Moniliophthora roreri]
MERVPYLVPSLETLAKSSTNSLSTFPRNMDVVASLPFVSPVFVKKSVTTTFARSPKWLPNISLPLDITIYTFHNAAGDVTGHRPRISENS